MAKYSDDYFAKRAHDCQIKINGILNDDLPDFCKEFFVGIQQKTSPLTRLNYAYDLRTFFGYLTQNVADFKDILPKNIAVTDLEKITQYDIEYYLSYVSDYTKNSHSKELTNTERGKARKLSAIKSLFKYFYKRGVIGFDITTKVDSPKIHDKEIIRLEHKEVNELLDTVETGNGLSNHQKCYHDKTKTRDMAIVSLLLGTGIRVSELVGINIDDIDFENNNFVVTRKGGNRVILYINPEIKQFVQEYYDKRTADINIPQAQKALFISLKNQRITTRAVENIVKKYAKIATPLKRITPHKLRSTFGTELYRSTGDIYIVADVLGHKDVNTTKKHYAAVSEDTRKKAAEYVKLYTDDDKN